MAKKAMVEKNKRRIRLTANKAKTRDALTALIKNKETPMEERVAAVLKRTKMGANSSKVRIRNRCELSGRPRGFCRKFKLSRIALRELASFGQLPGVVKSSW